MTTNTNDLWELLGQMDENEYGQILFQLFAKYEELQKTASSSQEANQFFNFLQAIVQQVQSCNVNRR
ncbi:MAG: hypothetical protein CSB34_04460 [Desulfobulbus propionicus]|nr:MAG: hypothetical protein CSB34_04460 [Desulfobulbus propionicus]